VNIVKEAPGYKMNVELYEFLMSFSSRDLAAARPQDILLGYAKRLHSWSENGGREYWGNYGKAILEWLSLFDEGQENG
jgi:hypothetical protein